MDIKNIKDELVKEIDRLKPELSALSRDIFNYPETAFKEFYAQSVLTDYLKGKGIAVARGTGGLKTAFKGVINEKKRSPAVALLAEYDALPSLGHACGHNVICASCVGAAAALKKISKEINGKVVIIGTPGEEGGGGKIHLINKGIFKGIDAAMMIHPSSKNKVVRRMLAVTEFKFIFTGKPAHASAHPEEGINALDALILTFNNINALRQQLRGDARIHGIIEEGGVAPNIIPERGTARFYVRAKDMDYFHEVVKKVKGCANAAALATGCKLTIETPGFTYKPFKPHYPIAELFSKNLAALGIKEDDISETEGMGSSDIGNVSHEIPTIHADIKICKGDVECHTSGFAKAASSDEGMNGMIIGAKGLALTAVDIINA